jgi:thioesterase domain-containing protein
VNVVELLAELRGLDAHIVLDEDRLILNAPSGAITGAHREKLRLHKAEIVEFLRAAQLIAGQQRAIVPLQPDGTQIPIFGVAGHNGDVFCYRQLARYLGIDQPFFGLQPPGLEEGAEPMTRVEDLSRYFARQIQEYCQQGPCVIVGFCAGGTVAFDLAKQLIGSGVTVKNLTLFGAPYCTSYRTVPSLIAKAAYKFRRVGVHTRSLLAMPALEWRQYLVERMRVLRSKQSTVVAVDPILARRRLVEQATVYAVRRYQPKPYPGHINLILPCESWKRSLDAPLRWGRIAASCAEFVGPDSCCADTMLLQEQVAAIAELFDKANS